MELLLSILYLLGGLIAVVYGSNWLVDGASSFAKTLKISDLVIGLTIVAFGTSTPELVVSLFSAVNGSTDIAIGNVVGSNIFNVLIILGLAAIVYPVGVPNNSVWIEIPLSVLAALVLGVCANDIFLNGVEAAAKDANGNPVNIITFGEGILFLCFFIVFLYYTIYSASDTSGDSGEQIKTLPFGKSILFIVLGLVGLVLGGKFFVDGAVTLAKMAGMSEAVIGLTIVAAGTSTPELATSIVAAYKKNSAIALGNVVGSNIFNIFFILGITALVKPLPFRPEANVDILMTILSSVAIFVFTFVGSGRKIQRWEGVLFVIAYVIYVIYLISNIS